MDFAAYAEKLQDELSLNTPPIAIAFRDELPEGVERVEEAAPAGCAYWKMAEAGLIFGTEDVDHDGCPIGAHILGFDVSGARGAMRDSMLSLMVGLRYMQEAEAEELPRLERGFVYVIYAPLAQAPCDPDVVLVRGSSKQMMMLSEAARSAGVPVGALGSRPTCGLLPQVVASRGALPSLGCVGARVFADLADDDVYFGFPGARLEDIIERLDEIIRSNMEIERFYRARLPEVPESAAKHLHRHDEEGDHHGHDHG